MMSVCCHMEGILYCGGICSILWMTSTLLWLTRLSKNAIFINVTEENISLITDVIVEQIRLHA